MTDENESTLATEKALEEWTKRMAEVMVENNKLKELLCDLEWSSQEGCNLLLSDTDEKMYCPWCLAYWHDANGKHCDNCKLDELK